MPEKTRGQEPNSGLKYEIEANSAETVYKLNTVSETINEMAKTYKEENCIL